MTEQVQRNIETAKRYIELYNSDVARLISECYTPDCTVYAMGAGVLEGAEQFLQVELAIVEAAPKRYFRLDHMHASGDMVTNEVTLLDPDAGDDWSIPMAAVFTLRDGKIAIDRSYADYTNWPGLAAFANQG